MPSSFLKLDYYYLQLNISLIRKVSLKYSFHDVSLRPYLLVLYHVCDRKCFLTRAQVPDGLLLDSD